MDNFRSLRGYGWKNFNVMKNWKQKKGQTNCVKSFLNSISSGEPTIAFDQLVEVGSASIDIDEIIRNQS